MAEIIYKHEKLLADEGITSFKGWPMEIVYEINGFRASQLNTKTALTPEKIDSLRRRSVMIADKIVNYLERNLTDETEIINQQNIEQMEKEQQEAFNAAKAKAKEAQNKKDWAGAHVAYKEALALSKDDAECIEQLAIIDQVIVDEKAANDAAAIEKEGKLAKDNYAALIATGDKAYGEKKLDAAKNAYTEALKSFPSEKYPADQLEMIAVEEGKAVQAAAAKNVADSRNSVQAAVEEHLDLDI